MENITPSYEKLTLLDGNEIKMTLNFKKLLYLRHNGYENDVKLALKILGEKDFDILDVPDMLWVAYLCADNEVKYEKDEFIGFIPWDVESVMRAFNNLNSKKKM